MGLSVGLQPKRTRLPTQLHKDFGLGGGGRSNRVHLNTKLERQDSPYSFTMLRSWEEVGHRIGVHLTQLLICNGLFLILRIYKPRIKMCHLIRFRPNPMYVYEERPATGGLKPTPPYAPVLPEFRSMPTSCPDSPYSA